MNRIAFLVNNEGIGDNRVVKTAEALAAMGADCTVYGCSRELDTARVIERASVRYVVLPLRPRLLRGLAAGFFPQTAFWLRGPTDRIDDIEATEPTYSETATLQSLKVSKPALVYSGLDNQTEATAAQKKPEKLPPWKQATRLLIITLRFIRHVCLLPVRILQSKLHPRNSSLGVRAMLGNYLLTFQPLLNHSSYDVVYAHELWMLESGAQYRRAFPASMLVYDSHELELHRNNDWTETANRARTSYEARYIHQADRIVTVSHSIAEYMAQTYGISQPGVLPNTPQEAKLVELPAHRKLKATLGLKSEVLAVYTGRVTIGRGLGQVLTAMTHIPNLHLATVGPRVPSVVSDLALQARELGLTDRIYFVDPVPPEQLVSLISDADIAVVPIENVCLSYYYSLPNKIFEAAMAGVPVLASDFPDLRRFVTEYGIGMNVDFDNPTALVAAIEKLVDERQNKPNAERIANLRHSLSFNRFLKPLAADIFGHCAHRDAGRAG